MTTTINASTSTGLVNTADTSGIIKLQSNGVTTNALAWVNFGYVSSAITIRANYNISSVTRNGTGDYTINFTSALSDANYSFMASGNRDTASYGFVITAPYSSSPTTSSIRMACVSGSSGTFVDYTYAYVAVFGN